MNELKLNNADLFPEITNLLQEGHTVTLGLCGYSMRPFLEDGRDNALLTKVDGTWKVGDPILAEIQPGHYVLHRIIKITPSPKGEHCGEATLLGDGNITPEHCHVSDFRAQIIGFYRHGSKHLDSIDGRKWRTYSYIWTHLRPYPFIRRVILALYRRLWLRLVHH